VKIHFKKSPQLSMNSQISKRCLLLSTLHLLLHLPFQLRHLHRVMGLMLNKRLERIGHGQTWINGKVLWIVSYFWENTDPFWIWRSDFWLKTTSAGFGESFPHGKDNCLKSNRFDSGAHHSYSAKEKAIRFVDPAGDLISLLAHEATSKHNFLYHSKLGIVWSLEEPPPNIMIFL